MNERERFIRAVSEDSGDDLTRLVLADWLEEYGEEERGTFLRAGVELARMDEADDRYPKLLARYRRSATFALEPKEPWLDFIPEGQAWFHRGMIVGASLSTSCYLKTDAKDWWRVPLEELELHGPQDDEAARGVARRAELSRLRLLCLSEWRRRFARRLLCGCEHLAGLRQLVLASRLSDPEGATEPSLEEFAEGIALPGLEALAWYGGDVLAWPALVPAFGKVARLMLMSGSGAVLDEGADSYGWLAGTPLWAALRQANVWHDINTIGFSTVYQTDPLPDFAANFAAAPLEDFRLAVDDIPRLAALTSWGALHTLRLGHCDLTDDLAPLADCPNARQLRRLLLDHPDGPEPLLGEPMPGVFATPYLADLRHLRYDTYYYAEGDLAGLRDAPFREGLLRLELGNYCVALPPGQLQELLARPWPALRHLRAGLGQEALTSLLSTRSLPNLCTLKTYGSPGLGEAAVKALARAPALPHLSLVSDHDGDWILGGGQARRVSPDVWLRDQDMIERGPYQ
jgi:uncharacterized protein (TIGR02996 family)